MISSAATDLRATPLFLVGFAALVIGYGAFLEPTPESVSFELVAFLLLAAVLFVVSVREAARWRALTIGFVALAVVAGVIGFARSNDIWQALRDLASFALIPFSVFAISRLVRLGVDMERVKYVLAIAGVILSVRYVASAPNMFESILHSNVRVDLRYLSSEPLVLFAFLFFIRQIFFAERWSLRLAAALLAGLASLGLVAVTYRGPLLLGAGLFVFYLIRSAVRPRAAVPLVLLSLLIVSALLAFDVIGPILEKIAAKTSAVGLNNKLGEVVAVFGADRDFLGYLFGEGLGGTTASPIFDFEVPYTHNVVTYVYVKFGLCGLALVAAFALFALKTWSANQKWSLPIQLPELLTVLYIAVMQAAYKHFGFALITALILVACFSARLNPTRGDGSEANRDSAHQAHGGLSHVLS